MIGKKPVSMVKKMASEQEQWQMERGCNSKFKGHLWQRNWGERESIWDKTSSGLSHYGGCC